MSDPKLIQPYCAPDCVNIRREAADILKAKDKEIERLTADLKDADSRWNHACRDIERLTAELDGKARLLESTQASLDAVITGTNSYRQENAKLQAALIEASTNPYGEYYLGLRCGVEDRDIFDRYEAAEFGWDQAFEYIESIAALEDERPNV